MKAKPHPEQGFRSCLGIIRLVESYGADRVEAASQRGNDIGANHLRLDQVDPAEWSRQSLRQLESAGRPADPARQHPRAWLLPLTHEIVLRKIARVRETRQTSRADKREKTMLTHPTHDRLLAPGAHRHGQGTRGTAASSAMSMASLLRGAARVCWSTARRSSARASGSSYASSMPTCGRAPSSRISTRSRHAASTRQLFAKLAAGEWIARRQDLLITGKTGTGKSWLACALGHKACRDDRSVLYSPRRRRLFDALALARGDGRHPRLLKSLARVELLILDDWGLGTLTSQQGRDLLEIVDDRHARGSTIVTSQLPVEHWHELIADPTIADAVLDRLVHTAHRLEP